jgi:molybdopterin-guanine dinucleotide biosynthesis protein A
MTADLGCTLLFLGGPPAGTLAAGLEALECQLLVAAPRLEPCVAAGLPCVAPVLPSSGDLALIHAGLSVARTPHVVVVRPDNVAAELVAALAAQPDHLDVVVKHSPPLTGSGILARFARRCIRPLERAARRDPAADPCRIPGLRVGQICWPPGAEEDTAGDGPPVGGTPSCHRT